MALSNTMYPKIASVIPLEDYRLRITFQNNITKIYDCSDVLNEPIFSVLRNRAVFCAVQVDQGGYGVFWNDDIDLSEAELWLHGKAQHSIKGTAEALEESETSLKSLKDTRTKQCT